MNAIEKITICVTALLAFFVAQSAKATDAPEGYAYIPMIEEGKAWHYRVCTDRIEDEYDDVKLVLQGDVERDEQTWKQCWFMKENGDLIEETPVVLLREEDKRVYVYPIITSCVIWDRMLADKGIYPQTIYCLTYYKNYEEYNSCGQIPIETQDDIDEVYPALLYDFNKELGDRMDFMNGAHWCYASRFEYSLNDIVYTKNSSRIYREFVSSPSDPEDFQDVKYSEGIGISANSIWPNGYFICPQPTFGIPTCWPPIVDANYPELLYVSDGEGNTIFRNGESGIESVTGSDAENLQLSFTDEKLKITSSVELSYSLHIYDISGQCLYTGNISESSPISISDILLPGVYVARASGSNACCTLKFAVTKGGL